MRLPFSAVARVASPKMPSSVKLLVRSKTDTGPLPNIHRGLDLACVSWEYRLADRGHEIRGEQTPPGERSDQRIGFENGSAAGEFKHSGVSAVTVEDDDALEAVVGEALAEIETESDEVFLSDMHGAWVVDRMDVVAVGNLRRDEHDGWRAAAGLQTNAVAEKIVDVEWKMRVVLLRRTNRKQNDFALLGGLVDFRPSQIAVDVFFCDR
jgi:hypothetical protein